MLEAADNPLLSRPSTSSNMLPFPSALRWGVLKTNCRAVSFATLAASSHVCH